MAARTASPTDAVATASLSGSKLAGISLYLTVAALFVVCFLPAWLAFVRKRIDYFELIHLFGFIYFLNFGAASIWVLQNPDYAYDIHLLPYVPQAAFYALLGYLAFLAGYYGPWTRGFFAAKDRTYLTARGPWALVLLGGIGMLGLMTWANVFRVRQMGGSAFTGITSFLGQLSFLFFLIWALANLLTMSGRASKRQKWAYWLFMIPAAAIIAQAYVSRKQLLVTLLLMPLVTYWYARRRFPWTWVISLFLIFVFVIFPIYNTVRYYDWTKSTDERLAMTIDSMRGWDTDEYLDRSLGSFQSRLALINSMAIVIQEVPRSVPYGGGKNYYMAPAIVFIPRFIWPDKPTLGSIGWEFGREFRIVGVQDELTSVAPSLPGELYWEFDLPGVLIGMALIGFGCRWIYVRFCATTPVISIDRALYIMLLMQLMVIEGAILSELVGLVRIFALLLIIKWALRKIGWLQPVPASASGVW